MLFQLQMCFRNEKICSYESKYRLHKHGSFFAGGKGLYYLALNLPNFANSSLEYLALALAIYYVMTAWFFYVTINSHGLTNMIPFKNLCSYLGILNSMEDLRPHPVRVTVWACQQRRILCYMTICNDFV
jgi:hypothetical protein